MENTFIKNISFCRITCTPGNNCTVHVSNTLVNPSQFEKVIIRIGIVFSEWNVGIFQIFMFTLFKQKNFDFGSYNVEGQIIVIHTKYE